MGHYPADVAHFLARSPYLQLAGRGAEGFVRRQLAAAEECRAALQEYPVVRIEPLAFAETCLRNLGALDLPFLCSLLEEHTWRGVVWAAWLALLDPRAEFDGALRAAKPPAPSQWIVDCAVAEVERRSLPVEHLSFVALARRYRECLHPIRRPVVRLRAAPTKDQQHRLEREVETIRRVYKTEGLEAAMRHTEGSLTRYYAMSYEEWLRAGAPEPPA